MVRDDIHKHRNRIHELARKHGATSIRLFGSVARGQESAASDVDFLVDFEPGRTLFDMSGLKLDLEELLGRTVQLTSESGLKPRLRSRVLADAVAV